MTTVINRGVASAWSRGESAHNHRNNYHTDGRFLWSYHMLIGITLTDGRKIALNSYQPYRVTTTTTHHSRYATWHCTDIVNPVRGPAFDLWNIWLFPRDLLSQSVGITESMLADYAPLPEGVSHE